MSSYPQKRFIYVYADWEKFDSPFLIGILQAELLRGNEVFSFEYIEKWLSESKSTQILDPDLQLYAGKHYLTGDKPNFGVFLDSAPDRWGRVLMQKREAALAREEKRPVRKLFETDYLLGVYDGYRMGALRFKEKESDPFLNADQTMATPPWTSIPQLEAISLQIEQEGAPDAPEYLKWLSILIAPGSSLGGSRPKASVSDSNKHLWLAKFPSKNDLFDVGGWEIVTYQLARQAGIQMSEAKAKRFTNRFHTFLTRRFDRTATHKRIHFASAMTLLGYNDGHNFTDGISYLEIVEFITRQGAEVETDLKELFRRIVFSICVSNSDDHLRNHGFLLTPYGWKLSPAYDINPVENATGLSLNISENDNSLHLDLAMEVYPYFNLVEKQAIQIVKEVKSAVKLWEKTAKTIGISREEQELKKSAFNAVI